MAGTVTYSKQMGARGKDSNRWQINVKRRSKPNNSTSLQCGVKAEGHT